MKQTLNTIILWLVLALYATTADAAPPDLGRTAGQPFITAHTNIQKAKVTTRYTLYYTADRETNIDHHTYTVTFDRMTQRLLLKRPGFTLLCDGKHLTLTSPSITGRYFRTTLTGHLTFEKLVNAVPDIAHPMPVELILLLEADPAPVLTRSSSDSFTALPPHPRDPQQRPAFQALSTEGQWTLQADPQTMRLNQASLVADANQLASSIMTDFRSRYDIQWDAIDEPIRDDVFTLDLEGLQEVGTMQEYLAAPPVAQVPSNPGNGGGNPAAGGGAPPGGAGGVNPGGGTLLGLEMPDVELETLDGEQKVNLKKLAEECAADDRLLVVEFYANWCRPSVLDVPALVAFNDWCEENDKPVTIVFVAANQQREQTGNWLNRLEKTAKFELDLPVLLDSVGDASGALRLPTLPRTFIVADGKVIDVLGGIKPTFVDDLKERVEKWQTPPPAPRIE